MPVPRLSSLAAMTIVAALSACFDADLTVTVTGPDAVKGEQVIRMDRRAYDMGAPDFCASPSDTLQITREVAICTAAPKTATFEGFGKPGPTSTTFADNGDGTVTVSMAVAPRIAGFREGLQERLATAPMDHPEALFAGHSVSFRIAGKEIVTSDQPISADGNSTDLVIPLIQIIEGTHTFPQRFTATVRY
jgi:hypothetical protein